MHRVEIDVFDVIAALFGEELLQPRLDALRRQRRALILVVRNREDRAPQPSQALPAYLKQVAPLARIGKIITKAQVRIDRLELEGGRYLDKLFRIGESLELDVSELAHRAAAAVAADHVIGF